MKTLRAGAAVALLSATGAVAQAQTQIAEFYRGKQVTIVVGSSAGGGYDLYGRLVQRFIGKYIPGNPNVVVQNMPGAGGNTAASYVARVAPKDGTVIGAPQAGSLVDQLISVNADQIKHDARTFNYIGSANSEVFTCVVRTDAPIRKFEELFSKDLLIGSSGGTTHDMPMALKNLLGAHIKLVSGYAGTREIAKAVDQSEVQGICGMGWTSIQSQRPDWFESKLVHVLVQESAVGDPDLNREHVPLAIDYVKDAEQRQMFELLYAQGIFTRPFFMAPEVPQERVDAIRAAFMKALTDPETIAEATRQRLVITAIRGNDLTALVRKLYAIPETSIAKLKAALADSP